MPAAEAPEDDGFRQSYNFAPGYHGLVYRADGPDHGGNKAAAKQDHGDNGEQGLQKDELETAPAVPAEGHVDDTKYKLQAMKWG